MQKLNGSNLSMHFYHVFELMEREKSVFQSRHSLIVEMV